MATVLITGCSSGFGMAGALAFARRGDTVYATVREPDRGESLLRRAGEEGLSVITYELEAAAPYELKDRHSPVMIELMTGKVAVEE